MVLATKDHNPTETARHGRTTTQQRDKNTNKNAPRPKSAQSEKDKNGKQLLIPFLEQLTLLMSFASLFKHSGLEIFHCEVQGGLPKELFAVRMYSLGRPAEGTTGAGVKRKHPGGPGLLD